MNDIGTCPPGITGTLCEITLNPCESYPCYNGGACSSVNGTWSCNCNSTCYTGLNCNVLEPTCSKQNCSGNGVCLNTGPCIYHLKKMLYNYNYQNSFKVVINAFALQVNEKNDIVE